MFLLLFYAIYLVISFLVVATMMVMYVAFCLLAFLVAAAIEVIRALARRRRPRKPALRRPPPQARFSNRR